MSGSGIQSDVLNNKSGGGGGIASINSDSTAAQIITGSTSTGTSASTSGGTTTISQIWTPMMSSNIRIMLESDIGVTNSSGKASQWVDQVAGITLVQATGANQPTINAAALNGLQTLTFNGSTTKLIAASSAYQLNQASAFTIYVICKPVAFSGTQFFCAFTMPTVSGKCCWFSLNNDSGNSYSDIQFSSNDNGVTFGNLRSGTIGLDTSAFRIYKLFYNGAGATTQANFKFQKDANTAVTAATGGAGSMNTTADFSIGVRTNNGATTDSFFNGDIYGLYFFGIDTDVTSSCEDGRMMSYAKNKLGAGI